ncbi:MAG: hypothetical protein FWC13_12100 [Oscillospiraceae bacterium]|nr:hypothetical protein [Oscillospiraceae bacterium]
MALGEFNLFQVKSKAQKEKEAAEYETWAFPHGEKQKEILTSRLKELKPKESQQVMVIAFLTVKELYEAAVKDTESEEDAIKSLIVKAKRYKQIIRPKDLSMYIAATIADAGVDENCEYPSAEVLRERIEEIEKLRQG